MGKEVYTSLSMLWYCFNFLTGLLSSLWVKDAAAVPSLHSYMKSRRERSAVMNHYSIERKGQQSQELICCRLITFENSQGISPVHLRDKTRGPPVEGERECWFPCLSHEKRWTTPCGFFLSLVHWLLCKVCLWFQGNILQKEVLLTIFNVGRTRFPLSISPLKGERKGNEHEDQDLVCQDLKIYLHAKVELLLWTPATTAFCTLGSSLTEINTSCLLRKLTLVHRHTL